MQSIGELAELFEVSLPTVYRTQERQRAQSKPQRWNRSPARLALKCGAR
ncbi:hypothetical protein OG876_01020 [Kribbella sp. NBC_00359]